jgi:ferredoxin
VILRFDATKCSGYGRCAEHLPSLFELDEWGYAALKGDGVVPDGQEEAARRAVADCPERAIAVVGEA